MANSLIAKAGSDFEIAPAGPTAATCIDVVDLGILTSQYYNNSSHKIEIYWVTTHAKEDLSAQLTVRKRYTLSLNEKANLAKDLKSWRGKAFSKDEAKEFDVEKLIGAKCLINIVHNDSNGNTYANVDSIMPLPNGTEAPEVPADYVRHIDRNPSRDQRSDHFQGYEDSPKQPVQQEAVPAGFEDDDDLPF